MLVMGGFPKEVPLELKAEEIKVKPNKNRKEHSRLRNRLLWRPAARWNMVLQKN